MSDVTLSALPVAATHVAAVPVTTVWSSPDSPRGVDEPMVRDAPDAVAWLAALDANASDDESGDGRLGLHGRVESQLLDGEPVVVTELDGTGRWAHVVAPWQLSPKDGRGYPGWVPAAHLRPVSPEDVALNRTPAADADLDGSGSEAEHPAIALARKHIGLPYLWSGLSPLGFDCSGLVLHTWRRLGQVVARDAYAQAEFAAPVALGEVQPGDLYFFARPGQRVHHVGIVVDRGRMVHASETGGVLVEEDLSTERIATLVAAGRLPLP
ncbi:NlpC/P60 family protein [Monashia sp. NPDC004114]